MICIIFVCGPLIGVKSKYGSGEGTCPGLIFINYIKYKRKVPFVGMTGWAVNSIAKVIEGSIPFLPISPYSLKVEQDTVNVLISVQFTLGAKVW